MRKGNLFVIAILLLAIGSGVTVHAVMQSSDVIMHSDYNIQVMESSDVQSQALEDLDETSSYQQIPVQRGNQDTGTCTRCRGSGTITGRNGPVPCPGSNNKPCPARSQR
ncbi:MAG: hypothetical protein FWD28_04320 [Treponema sp.]|nr:hypothetical protein [Treponema sp.]